MYISCNVKRMNGLLTILFFITSSFAFAQEPVSRIELSQTFRLNVKQINFKDIPGTFKLPDSLKKQLSKQTSISTKPDTMKMDDCNRFAYGLRNYNNRFTYLLFSGYPKKADFRPLYP